MKEILVNDQLLTYNVSADPDSNLQSVNHHVMFKLIYNFTFHLLFLHNFMDTQTI